MKKLCVIFAFTMFFFGCKEPTVDSAGKSKIKGNLNGERIGKLDHDAVNEELETLSKALAKAIHNSSLRQLIKDQALLEVDGDFDILYSEISGKSIDETSQLHNNLRKSGVSDKILSDLPSTQISVPVLCKEWDTKKQIPIVAFIPFGEDDSKLGHIVGYDSKGISHNISLKSLPSQPVIVVSIGERYDILSGKLLPQYKDIKKRNAARLASSSESLYWMHFQNLGDYEPWAKGRPEIRLTIAGVRNG